MLAQLTGRQFLDWIDYEHATGPLGHARDDLHWGLLIATIANQWRRKGSATITPEENMPYLRKPELSRQELVDRVRAAVRTLRN